MRLRRQPKISGIPTVPLQRSLWNVNRRRTCVARISRIRSLKVDIMKKLALALMLIVVHPAFAGTVCKTVADDVVYQDQILKAQASEFSMRYDESHSLSMEASRDYIDRLDNLINTLRRDIGGMRWLIEHHCGPAKEESNAIKSVHDMELTLTTLIVRRMDARSMHR